MSATATQSDPWLSAPVETAVAALRRAVLEGQLAQAESALRGVLSNGVGVVALISRVLEPLVCELQTDDRAGHECRGASATLDDLIARLRPAHPTVRHTGELLVCCPGEEQRLVAKLAACALEHDGWHVRWSGHLSPSDLQQCLLDRAKVSHVVLSAGSRALTETVRAQVHALREVTGTSATVIALEGAVGAAQEDAREGTFVATSIDELVEHLRANDAPLTARELLTLRMVAEGLTNGQIAHRLGLAPSTVKSRLDAVFGKLSVPDRAAAVAYAIRERWIS